MQNLIEKYGLRIYKGPSFVYNFGDFNLDKRLDESQFFEVVANPVPSYDEMFPFPMKKDSEGPLHLFLLEYSRDMDTRSFLSDVVNEPNLRLVGVHGMILFTESFFGFIPEDKDIAAPAYQITKNYLAPGTDNEAHVPYFQLHSNRTKVLVKYSKSLVGYFSDPGSELILIGQIPN